MKHEFTVMCVHDPGHNLSRRRAVIVDIRKESIPEAGWEEPYIREMTVQYYAYGAVHYTAAVELSPGGGNINYKDAAAISIEIKKCLGRNTV